jgi:hypothetical protein
MFAIRRSIFLLDKYSLYFRVLHYHLSQYQHSSYATCSLIMTDDHLVALIPDPDRLVDAGYHDHSTTRRALNGYQPKTGESAIYRGFLHRQSHESAKSLSNTALGLRRAKRRAER